MNSRTRPTLFPLIWLAAALAFVLTAVQPLRAQSDILTSSTLSLNANRPDAGSAGFFDGTGELVREDAGTTTSWRSVRVRLIGHPAKLRRLSRLGGTGAAFDVAIMGFMEDLELLVLNALRDRPHATHLTIDQAVAEAKKIGAARTLFTHLSHESRHAEVSGRLPQGVELAYDGLVIDIAEPT